MEWAGLVASAAMGVVLGLMGGGGSILTVPIMVYLFKVPPHAATGYSLFVVGSTALVGSLVYMRRGDVDFRTAFTFALPSFIGVFTSRSWIVPSLPEVLWRTNRFSVSKDLLIMTAFALLMLAAAFGMLRRGRSRAGRDALVESCESRNGLREALVLSAQGLLVGLIAGFVGAGGGFIIVPALVMVAGLGMRVAVGTSLLVIAIQSLLGFTGDLRHSGEIDWTLLLTVAALAVGGIMLGSAFSDRIAERRLKKGFGWFVLVMGTVIFLEQIRRL